MEIVDILEKLIVLGILFAAAWMDNRKKELPVVFSLSGVVAGILFQIITKKQDIGSLFLGCGIGILFLGIGKITRQAVGYGDGLMLIVTGAFLGFQKNVLLVFAGFFMAAVFSVGVLIFRKKQKKEEIPFMPFLFGGYVFLLAFA